MEILQPSNFMNLFEVVASLITGIVASVGVFYGIQTYFLAREAKDEWLNQKNHEYDVIVKSNLSNLINLVDLIYNVNYNRTQIIINAGDKIKYKGDEFSELKVYGKKIPGGIELLSLFTYTLEIHKTKLENVINIIHPAVIGLDNKDLNKLYYDIADFISGNDKKIEELKVWIFFF